LDALAEVERIKDPAERARAATRILRESKRLTELRGEDVVQLLARPHATLRSVGDEVGLHWTTVQSIRDAHLRKSAGQGDA
jgi:hypothetical protein